MNDPHGFLRDLHHADNGPWFSHRALLLLALEATRGSLYPVLEMGMGDGSTPYLHRYCMGEGRQLVSLDNDAAYAERFAGFRSEAHEVENVEWDAVDLAALRWSVVLADHAPPERRGIDIARLANRADIIVIHDSEPTATRYGLEAVWPLFRWRVDMNLDGVGTSAVSNAIDIESGWTGMEFEERKIARARRA